MTLTHLATEALGPEEHLLFTGFYDDGTPLDNELCGRLFRCVAEVKPVVSTHNGVMTKLDGDREQRVQAALSRALEQSNRFFHEERERLERWADDMVLGAEKELSDTKAQLRALGRQARFATTTDEQHTLQLNATLRFDKRELGHADGFERELVTLLEQLRARSPTYHSSRLVIRRDVL